MGSAQPSGAWGPLSLQMSLVTSLRPMSIPSLRLFGKTPKLELVLSLESQVRKSSLWRCLGLPWRVEAWDLWSGCWNIGILGTALWVL